MADRPDRRDKAALGRWLGVPPSDPAAGAVPTLFVKEQGFMKADSDGVYTTTDEQGIVHRFKVAKGDAIPEGADFAAVPDEDAPVAATDPKAKAIRTGPTDTTAARGPSATG